MKAPITAPVARQISTEAHHGHSLRVTAMPISAAAVPAVKPADRSISPSSSTKTRPIAITVTAEAWWMRLDEVERVGEGRRSQHREDDHQHDQPEHGRQRADVAAAHPGDVVADCRPEPARGRRGDLRCVLLGDGGRGHDVASGAAVDAGAAASTSASSAASSSGLSAAARPIDPDRPEVISSTTSLERMSFVLTWAAILPR